MALVTPCSIATSPGYVEHQSQATSRLRSIAISCDRWMPREICTESCTLCLTQQIQHYWPACVDLSKAARHLFTHLQTRKQKSGGMRRNHWGPVAILRCTLRTCALLHYCFRSTLNLAVDSAWMVDMAVCWDHGMNTSRMPMTARAGRRINGEKNDWVKRD